MNAATEFDVFVSYNTLDHKAVDVSPVHSMVCSPRNTEKHLYG